MAKRGVGGEALLAYVEANPIVTKLEPETIVYLNDLGVPENVVAAMIRKPTPTNHNLPRRKTKPHRVHRSPAHPLRPRKPNQHRPLRTACGQQLFSSVTRPIRRLDL